MSPLMTILLAVFGMGATFILGMIAWGLQRQFAATSANTTAVAVLTKQMDAFDKHNERLIVAISKMEKMQDDLRAAHSKIRKIISVGKFTLPDEHHE